MENIDLILFTAVLVILFIFFGAGTYLEFKQMNKEGFNTDGEVGGAETFLKTVGQIFSMSRYKK